MFDKIKELLTIVENSCSDLIIREYAPILYFGDIKNSKIATVGLNPSDREYYNSNGQPSDRFLSKQDLEIDSWTEISNEEISKIKLSFDFYFNHNPYKNWFNRLENLLTEGNYSYYFPYNNIVHLDIIPVATKKKWGSLSAAERKFLIDSFGNYLEFLISESDIEICILNGQGVVDNFQKVFNQLLSKEHILDWDIKTKNKIVKGNSYKAILDKGNKKVLILGFNHNIQSSFGVSKEIVLSKKKWLQKEINDFYERQGDLPKH